jgi:hypothetical protein
LQKLMLQVAHPKLKAANLQHNNVLKMTKMSFASAHVVGAAALLLLLQAMAVLHHNQRLPQQ